MQPPDPDAVHPFLLELTYPKSKEQLMHVAENEGVDGEILRAMRCLPDRTYGSPKAVMEQVACGS